MTAIDTRDAGRCGDLYARAVTTDRAAPRPTPTAAVIDEPEIWRSIAADDRPVLALDFDGTVCIGDAPVWAYAEALLEQLGAAATAGFADHLRRGLSDFLNGSPGSPPYLDGYAAVATLAADAADPSQLNAAYRASRAALADHGPGDVAAPPGLDELLTDLDGRVWRVLVTNAPADGVAATLRAIGVADMIDVMVTDAGKPDGWAPLLEHLLADRNPAAVFSVGDIWANDLAQPLAAGATTGLIDRFDQQAGPAHATGADFPALYPAIRQWIADPPRFAADRFPKERP